MKFYLYFFAMRSKECHFIYKHPFDIGPCIVYIHLCDQCLMTGPVWQVYHKETNTEKKRLLSTKTGMFPQQILHLILQKQCGLILWFQTCNALYSDTFSYDAQSEFDLQDRKPQQIPLLSCYWKLADTLKFTKGWFFVGTNTKLSFWFFPLCLVNL